MCLEMPLFYIGNHHSGRLERLNGLIYLMHFYVAKYFHCLLNDLEMISIRPVKNRDSNEIVKYAVLISKRLRFIL